MWNSKSIGVLTLNCTLVVILDNFFNRISFLKFHFCPLDCKTLLSYDLFMQLGTLLKYGGSNWLILKRDFVSVPDYFAMTADSKKY